MKLTVIRVLLSLTARGDTDSDPEAVEVIRASLAVTAIATQGLERGYSVRQVGCYRRLPQCLTRLPLKTLFFGKVNSPRLIEPYFTTVDLVGTLYMQDQYLASLLNTCKSDFYFSIQTN